MTVANDMYSRVSTVTGRFFSNLGGIVLYPGFTVTQNFNDLGVGIAQPFVLSQGHPLTAVQDFNDPFFIERQSSPSNPLAAAAQFGEISPLPYAMQWNFGIQRDLGSGIIADVSYIGSRGVNLLLSQQFNLVPFERGEEVARAGSSVVNQQSRRFPNVNNLGSFVHAGTSSYHSLQLKGVRQFSKQLSFLTSEDSAMFLFISICASTTIESTNFCRRVSTASAISLVMSANS